jgi:hypothetical protein
LDLLERRAAIAGRVMILGKLNAKTVWSFAEEKVWRLRFDRFPWREFNAAAKQ